MRDPRILGGAAWASTACTAITLLTAALINAHAIAQPQSNTSVSELANSCLIELPGDVNVNGSITSLDVIAVLNYCFNGAANPEPCEANGDVNCDGAVTAGDVLYLVNHVFRGGDPPCDICADSPMDCTPNL